MEDGPDEPFCINHLRLFPTPDGVVRVSCPHTRRVAILSAEEAQSLSRCSGVKTTAGHVAAVHTDRRALAQRALNTLIQSGLVLSRRNLVERLGAATRSESKPAITAIRITTLNQPPSLQRCVRSYADNASAWGRRIQFTVLDDERNEPVWADYLSALRLAAGQQPVRYVGYRDVHNYCGRLSSISGVDPTIVAFALMPDPRLRRTDGGNKNALMLDGTSECYLQVDDDTECRVGCVDYKPGTRFYFGAHPMECRYFPTRDQALSAVNWEERDMLACHEAALGRTISDIVSTTDGEVHFDGPMRELCDSLLTENVSRVRVTYAGLAGDAASESAFYRTSLSGAAFDRLTASESTYAAMKVTREVVRSASILTLTRPVMSMAFTMGCDTSRSFLPPFFPLGRSYERVFSVMLGRCFPSAFVAQLPYAIVHAAPVRPSYSEPSLWEDITRLRLPDLAGLLLAAIPATPYLRAAVVLERAGQTLRDWSTLKWGDFNDLVVTVLTRERHAHLTGLCRLLQERAAMPPWWARDVQRQIEVLERGLIPAVCPALSDYPQYGGQDADAQRGLQEVLRQFGDVLASWPALFEAAKELKERRQSLSDVD
jgi:hypothetical protein